MNKFRRATFGAGLVEYSLLAGLISIVSIGSVISLGNQTLSVFSTSSAIMSTAGNVASNSEDDHLSPEISIAEFSFEADNYGNSDGIQTPYHSMSTATGSFVVSDLYEHTHPDPDQEDTTVFKIQGDVSSDLTAEMFIRCNNGDADLPFSDAKYGINYVSAQGKTIMTWSLHPLGLVVGESYTCNVMKPA
jgi:Flp pilus assembly pilin Flp